VMWWGGYGGGWARVQAKPLAVSATEQKWI